MRCLMCGKTIGENSLRELLAGDDLLCEECRNGWHRTGKRFTVDGVKAYAEYAYDGGFRDCLLQFKECGDEALKDVFLYKTGDSFRRKYRGWTLLLMPSSPQNLERRGFSHLQEIFSCVRMPMLEVFAKTDTAVQKELTYEERQQMKEHIILKEGAVVPKKVLLCDDVLTTGATIRGALKALQGIPCRKQIYILSAVEKTLP